MRIECVQICVNYADLWVHTIPFNKYMFDRMVVVTSHDDKETSKAAEFYHIECIKTNIFDKGMNKGMGINLGLNHLSRTDFLCQMDADIILMPRTRYLLEIAKLRKDTLYSAHRQMVPSYEAFAKWMASPTVEHENEIFLHNRGFPLGTQIGKLSKDPNDPSDLGWCACGYLQIWNESDGIHRVYPEKHNTFARSDLEFNYLWPRERRALIPEFSVLHIQTDDVVKMGQNWARRSTKIFGPALLT